MGQIKYLDKRGLVSLVKEIKKRTSSVYVIKGSAVYVDEDFLASDDKPSADIDRVGLWHEVDGVWKIVEEVKLGWVYNVTNDFTTTGDFIEGAGKPVPAGTNIVAAEFKGASDATAEVRWDTLSMNIDLTPYQQKWLSETLKVVEASDGALEAESEDLLSVDPEEVEDGQFAVITSGDDKGAVYRATVSETLVAWKRLGDQVTVEGALELIGNVAPNTPISDKEIVSAFTDA